MKKFSILALSLILSFSITACGKSEAAKNVDKLITDIGEVTLDSEAKISAAEAALKNLSSEDSKQLDNAEKLKEARKNFTKLTEEKRKAELQELTEKAAKKVEQDIASIGNVTKDKAQKVKDVREAYNKLNQDTKSLVKNYQHLENAEETINTIYVKEVEDAINSIGIVTEKSSEKISTANNLLKELSPENAAKVSNVFILEDAKKQLKEINQNRAEKLLSKMRKFEDKVNKTTFYESPVQPQYIDIRSYVLPWIGKNADGYYLGINYVYTGDDWIFFKNIKYLIDDRNDFDIIGYNNIQRDNANGKVWEYYFDAGVGEADINKLWKIANSNETIIRFQGDAQYYDLTVSQKDKDAIRDVLTVYEMLKEQEKE